MGRILRELAGEVENGDDMSFGKRTFMLYTEIEQKIRKIWLDVAKEIGAKILLIHDGFNSDVKMDETELTEKIKSEIGYDVKIEGGVLWDKFYASQNPLTNSLPCLKIYPIETQVSMPFQKIEWF